MEMKENSRKEKGSVMMKLCQKPNMYGSLLNLYRFSEEGLEWERIKVADENLRANLRAREKVVS